MYIFDICVAERILKQSIVDGKANSYMDEKRFYRFIGEKIREVRTKNRYKQIELARKVGLERTSITNIETGKQNVTVLALYRICEVFQLDINKLLPNPEDLVEHDLDTSNLNSVKVGAKTHAVLERVRNG